MHQRLTTMAHWVDARAGNNFFHLVPEQGDVSRALAVGGRCEQADETPFADRLAGFVVGLDANVVEIGVPVNGRAGVRFRQDQPVLCTRKTLRLAREFDGLVFTALIVR